MSAEARAYRTVVVTTQGPVTTFTLNRPERRNAIGAAMANELLWALEDALAAQEIRCIVLTGAGEAFCVGGDFQQLSGGEQDALASKGGYPELLLALWRSSKPLIARVNGHALGGGLGLVAACHFAVASAEAKLGTPEVNVGLFPFMIYALLERLVPRRRLLEMMLGGEKWSAVEAEQVGLLSRVVPPAELDAAVQRYVTLVTSKSGSTMALGLRAMADVEGLELDEKLRLLEARLFECLGTEDAREGLSAFLQRRPPVWTGR